MKIIRKRYSELIGIETYEDRFQYLKLFGSIGEETFGSNRYLNQILYSSKEWKDLRKTIIVRDNGMEMACDGYPIQGYIYVHHINPITEEDILNRSDSLFDPENLVCVGSDLHRQIHYGGDNQKTRDPIIRKPNDTCPWR